MRDWMPLTEAAADKLGLCLRHTRMSDVLRAVSECSGISVELLLGPRRQKHIARPRQIAMLVMRERCPWNSYPEMGRLLGGRDHTTILHGCRTAAKRVQELPEHRDLYEAVLRRLDRVSAIPAAREERPSFPPAYAA